MSKMSILSARGISDDSPSSSKRDHLWADMAIVRLTEKIAQQPISGSRQQPNLRHSQSEPKLTTVNTRVTGNAVS